LQIQTNPRDNIDFFANLCTLKIPTPLMPQIVTTADGSFTLYNSEIDEHYHSVYGAIMESQHVFIKAGFDFVADRYPHMNLLEVGFGTGLNALLTSIETLKRKVKVNYIGVEAHPLSCSIISKLNYPSLLDEPKAGEFFNEMHTTPWNYPAYINDDFILNKIHARIEEVELRPHQFNLVYFDAFAPDKQPEIWVPGIFRKISNCLVTDGVLVTYSSKGTVKQALRDAGFEVERLPGPAGKRHMIRAIKLAEDQDS
jgi:tRNA U34 5-methylaminomethyl-2-thiouridine-forming methyltransferase MnmC